MRYILAGMFLVMFTLKLIGKLDGLSWWWVTSPLWLPLAVVAGVVLCCCVVLGAIFAWEHFQGKDEKRKEFLKAFR
jgi:hypothetical protein